MLPELLEVSLAPKPYRNLPEKVGQPAKAYFFLTRAYVQQSIPDHFPKDGLRVPGRDPVDPCQERTSRTGVGARYPLRESNRQLLSEIITVPEHRHDRLVDERQIRVGIGMQKFHIIQLDSGGKRPSQNVPDLVDLTDRLNDLDSFRCRRSWSLAGRKQPAQEIGIRLDRFSASGLIHREP